MTEKMKTVCVGRYLIDVPGQADIALSGEMIAGFTIDTVEESDTAFHSRIAAREADIVARGKLPATEDPGGMVEARDLRIGGLVGRTFVYGRDSAYGFEDGHRVDYEWVSVESHAHVGNLSFTLSAKYADEDSARLAETLLATLHVRGADEIPSVPGFCISHGVFAEPLPKYKTEHVTFHLGLPGHPDMGFAFNITPGGGNDPSLLERYAKIDAEADPDESLRVTRLRSGKRSINGIDGEEIVERVRELNFTTGYSLLWETHGHADDLLSPYLLLNMQTGTSPRPGGKPVDSSLHENALLDLWDRISSSIRLRPSGPPPAPSAPSEPPSPKLGALATAGDTCPYSGWWKCRDGGPGVDVQGGAVQWISKGERMPQAMLLPRQTLWQKLRDLQPTIEPAQPTRWKLVDQRLRPRAPAAVALAQPGLPASVAGDMFAAGPATSLGTNVRTGDICPASGWWRCDEPHALDGARWFARGSMIPAATFRVPGRVFPRSAGPQVIQRRSTWRLMRHAEAETVLGMDANPPASV